MVSIFQLNPNFYMEFIYPVLREKLRKQYGAQKIIEMETKPTLSDGTAGGIEPGSITFDICRICVDEFVLLSEGEIKEAICLILEKHDLLVEGAAALSVAAFLKKKKDYKNKNVILILSGKRIGLDTIRHILCQGG